MDLGKEILKKVRELGKVKNEPDKAKVLIREIKDLIKKSEEQGVDMNKIKQEFDKVEKALEVLWNGTDGN